MGKTATFPHSYWIDTTPSATSFPKLTRDLDVDVAIVGGGITGITTALLLQRAGKQVALLEAHRLAVGVTGNTTAHLTEALDTRYVNLVKDFGLEGARLAAVASRAALERIEAFIQERRIECQFEHLPGYLYSEDESELEALHQEYEAAQRAGVIVDMTREVPLAFAKVGVRFDNQAAFHVREYLRGLIEELEERGALLCEYTPALELSEEGDRCVVRTESGIVKAKDLVVAANVPLTKFQLQTKIGHHRSYAMAFSVAERPLEGLFWDTATPNHYLRSGRSLSNPAPVLIVGGEDHRTGTDEATDDRYEALVAYTRARFSVHHVVARWSAQVIEPADGLPYIGKLSDHTYVGTGYSGNGITLGTVAAMTISDKILERGVLHHPWAELFDANRVNVLASFQRVVKENAGVALHMVGDRLKTPDAHDLADVKPGEGKIVELDGKRVAVHRDASGKVHACSAVCPHLGCIVHFNSAEVTWDCPCHGSRFGIDGGTINGPATTGLTPYPAPAEKS